MTVLTVPFSFIDPTWNKTAAVLTPVFTRYFKSKWLRWKRNMPYWIWKFGLEDLLSLFAAVGLQICFAASSTPCQRSLHTARFCTMTLESKVGFMHTFSFSFFLKKTSYSWPKLRLGWCKMLLLPNYAAAIFETKAFIGVLRVYLLLFFGKCVGHLVFYIVLLWTGVSGWVPSLRSFTSSINPHASLRTFLSVMTWEGRKLNWRLRVKRIGQYATSTAVGVAAEYRPGNISKQQWHVSVRLLSHFL